MKKILITGGTGMLGAYLVRSEISQRYDLIQADREQFDLASPAEIHAYVLAVKPDAVLHLAAETNVDLCEKEPQRAAVRNHLATQAIARACAQIDAWLAYVSTSNVFGAEGKLAYNELDMPMPVNYYGRSKLFGEHAIRTERPRDHLIVRAGWMIGGGAGRDHKFVGKIIEQIRNNAAGLKAVGDKYGTITRAKALSELLAWALECRLTGTYHFASEGLVTRFDIAASIAEFLGYEGPVTSVESSQFPLSAPRPMSEGIRSIYLPTFPDAPAPASWKQDLKTYIQEFES
jgi:dTDP-4-dehydrorhamnose reductase